MPKSKKNKIVHLTQVKKKGKDHKEELMKQLEAYIERYAFVYVFDFDATKSDRIMSLRLKMKPHGAIFAGRNSLVSVAMKSVAARSKADHKRIMKHITGHRGLLFTDMPRDELLALLEDGQQEFRDKLLGHAPLNSTRCGGGGDEPAPVAGSDGEAGEEEEEEEEEEGDDDEGDDADETMELEAREEQKQGQRKAEKRNQKPKSKQQKHKQNARGSTERKSNQDKVKSSRKARAASGRAGGKRPRGKM